MGTISDDIDTIRFVLHTSRVSLKERGKFVGEAFDIMWSVDNNVETALNFLIDLERKWDIISASE